MDWHPSIELERDESQRRNGPYCERCDRMVQPYDTCIACGDDDIQTLARKDARE